MRKDVLHILWTRHFLSMKLMTWKYVIFLSQEEFEKNNLSKEKSDGIANHIFIPAKLMNPC